MENNSITGSVKINAPFLKVWNVLTNPDKIMRYTGSTIGTDWSPGSPIIWEGALHGRPYQNKGRVLENESNRILRYTYWSGMGGDADEPENYSEIIYTLNPVDGNSTELTYTRIKIPTAIEKQIFEVHLPSMLEEIKKLSEE